MSKMSLFNTLLRNKKPFPANILQPATSNLVAWYKTESLGLTDGQAVASWLDETSNNNDLAQATSGKRPTFKTGVLLGRDAVRFSATNDTCLINTTPTGFTSDGLTIYAVVKAITWSTWGMVVVTGVNPIFNELRLTNTQSTYGFIAAGGTGPLLGTTEGTGPWAARIFRGRFDNTSDVVGVKVTGFTENTSSDAGTYSSTVICLGARDNADTALNYDGDLGEVLIYTADISAPDKAQTESYLQSRWGIAA